MEILLRILWTKLSFDRLAQFQLPPTNIKTPTLQNVQRIENIILTVASTKRDTISLWNEDSTGSPYKIIILNGLFPFIYGHPCGCIRLQCYKHIYDSKPLIY